MTGRDRPLSLSRVTGVCEGNLPSGERVSAGAVVERESFLFSYRSNALVPTYGARQGSLLAYLLRKQAQIHNLSSETGHHH